MIFLNEKAMHYEQMDFKRELLNNEVKTMISGQHRVYAVPAKCIMDLSASKCIETWSGNRRADPMRVKEIRMYMMLTKRCPGTICLAEIGDKLVCYDGNHRREALVHEVSFVTVDVMHNASEEQVRTEFKVVNNCVMVPDMYVEDVIIHNASEEVTNFKVANSYTSASDICVKDEVPISSPISSSTLKKAIEDFAISFCKQYKDKVSASARCHRPRFNKDVFIQDVYEAYQEMKGDVKILFDNIRLLNRVYSEDSSFLDCGTIKTECNKSGLWLFAKDRHLPINDLRRIYSGELRLEKY